MKKKNIFSKCECRVEYLKEGAFWGDLYMARVYETHQNTPGFAPTEYEVLICEMWLKYDDWERRIYFKDTNMEDPETLRRILEIFTTPMTKKELESKIKEK